MIDRKGWIILILCSIALIGNYIVGLNTAQEQRKAIAEQQAEQKADEATKAPAETTGELEVLPQEPSRPEETHTLETKDTLFAFSSDGGGIDYAEFKDELAVNSKTSKVRLNRFGGKKVGTLTSSANSFVEEPMLVETATEEKITYIGRTRDGLVVKKTYSLLDDQSLPGASNRVLMDLTIQNPGQTTFNLENYYIYLGSAAPLYQREWDPQNAFFYYADGDFEPEDPSDFKGGMFSSPQPIITADAQDVEYAGVMNQFFATILKQKNPERVRLWSTREDAPIPDEAGGGMKSALSGGLGLPAKALGPGESATFQYELFMGPKENQVLRALGDERGEVMHYGWFSLIARFFNTVLNWLHDIAFGKIAPVWGWGLSIVTLTILIRTAIWPLHNKSQRTMKRMAKLQPKMAELKEKYGDDPNKMNQETMKMYRDFGINPLGGCLPMFAQIPIFFGFYKMLQYAVELRDQPFLWVDDLSQPDTIATIDLPFALPFLGDALPINLLPILMAVTMVIQMKMTPQAGDPLQRRIMMLMPVMFFVFCYNFAAALALYWTTQNIFSIGQTAYMKRVPEPELTKSNKPRKKTLAERVAEMEAAKKDVQMRKAKGRDVTDDKGKKKKRGPRTGG